MSAVPSPYTQNTDYGSYQIASPNQPLGGDDIDAEFAEIANFSVKALARLALITNDDGSLKINSIGDDVAALSALNLNVPSGNSEKYYFNITGSGVSISSIATISVGRLVYLRFEGVNTLVWSSSDLVTVTGGNITTEAGDHCAMMEVAAGQWRMLWYSRASGEALAALTHEHSAADITSGALADGRIAESNVTQHEAALTIIASQLTETSTKKVMTDVERNILGTIETGATQDQTASEIEASYNAQVAAASEAEARAGTEAAIRRFSPLRISQAIATLGAGGSSTFDSLTDTTVTSIAAGEIIKWSGAAWINNTLAEAGIVATTDTRLTDARTPTAHNHAASEITSGTLAHERGGLEADVSAYSGFVKISGGVTSAVTDASANWNTAYGWGDHSGGGYLASTDIDTLTKLNGIVSETLIETGDSRLSDARTPTTHSHVQTKEITIEDPIATEDVAMFYSHTAITISRLTIVLVGSGSPSVTVDIRHHTDRSNAGLALITTPAATTSTTTGNKITVFNDATVPAGSFIRCKTTAQSGTVTEMMVTIEYTED